MNVTHQIRKFLFLMSDFFKSKLSSVGKMSVIVFSIQKHSDLVVFICVFIVPILFCETLCDH